MGRFDTPWGTFILVPDQAIARMDDEDRARRFVRTGLESSSEPELRRLIGHTGGSTDALEEALVRALVSGRLVAIQIEEEVRLLDEPRAITLSELIVDPQPAQPASPRHEPETTWVSFELVDDAGRPIGGRFVASLDGRAESGPTSEGPQRYDDLPPGTTMTLALSELVPEP